jgi:hypothetical protein
MRLKLTFEYAVDVKVRVKAYSGTAQALFDQLFLEVQSENRLELFSDEEWGNILLNIVYKHFHSRNYQYYKLLNFDIRQEYQNNQIHLSGDVDLMTPEEVGSGIDILDELVRYLDPILEKRVFDMMTRVVGNLVDDGDGIEVTDVIVSDKPLIANAILKEIE